MTSSLEYDVALSFAGEDREYVSKVAHGLRARGVKVFYDDFEEVGLWGKDLFEHLTAVYQSYARFTVMFISAAYAEKLWTNHERRAAQARAFQGAQEYILPVRFDDTEIPGVLPTTGYISLNALEPDKLVAQIIKKLVSVGGSVPTELVRKNFAHSTPNPGSDPTEFNIIVTDDEGEPIEGCGVSAQAENGTTISGTTDQDGRCVLDIKTRRAYSLLIAHPQYPAALIETVDPADGAAVTLQRTEQVGSIIIHSTGHIPGLKGRLNPIRDTSDRTYIYASNIAIDGGKSQPVPFDIGHPIELEDADGAIVFAVVKHIFGRVALIQFTRSEQKCGK